MREDFSPATINSLKTRAGHVCSFPGCAVSTAGPSLESATSTSNTGVAAHICAAAQGPGARRRLNLENFPVTMLSDYSNGIWMCQTHAKLIDTDEVSFTIGMLVRWRELAELRAQLRQGSEKKIEVHLREGNEIPLAVVGKSFQNCNNYAVNELCNAVIYSCISDVWGEDIGHAVKDVVAELMINSFRHGGATKFDLDIDPKGIRIRSDDRPYAFSQLLSEVDGRGGQQAAKLLMEFNREIITSYVREENHNILNIVFCTSSEQVLRDTRCSIRFEDFVSRGFGDSLPDIYSDCETIYVVLNSNQHFIPSFVPIFSNHLEGVSVAQKKIVLIGSSISKGVVSMLQAKFPNMQVMKV